MSDRNPYEAPQSELSASKRGERAANEKPRRYPGIVPYAYFAQLSSVLARMMIGVVYFRPEPATSLVMQSLGWAIVVLIPVLIGCAIRYRIAWLLAVEMFLIGLVCVAFVDGVPVP
jgi:hypothetical protein